MTPFGSLFRRSGRPRRLRVNSRDAFAACCDRFGVTHREGEIIRLLLEGKDNKAITAALFISDHTVKNHIHNIYRKLGIKNRVQLVQCFRGALEDPGQPAAAPAAPRAAARWIVPAGVLVFAAAAAIVFVRPWHRAGAASPDLPVLAVLDFENLSTDAEMDKWVTGLPLLLATDLMQSKLIRTLSDDTVFGALRKLGLAERKRYSRDELRLLARELRADFLITGTFLTAGGRIVVTTVLQDARTGEPLRTDKMDCADERELMRRVDGLARLVRSGLKLSSAPEGPDIDVDAELLTTSSPLAYKYYAEGRRYHRTGDYEQAILMQQKAVELDPEFAIAWRAMGVGARNLGFLDRERAYLRRAFELADALPEDCRERLVIRGDYYSLAEDTRALSAEAFARLLEDHPDDIVAANNLGQLHYALEDYEAGLRSVETVIRRGVDNPFPYYTAADCLNALGRSREAVRLLEGYLETFPANRVVFHALIGSLIAANDFAGAAAVLERADGIFPEPEWGYLKGTVLFHTQGPAAAREEFNRLLFEDRGTLAIRARIRLGFIDLAGGRFRAAEDQLHAGAGLADAQGQPGIAADLRLSVALLLLDAGKPAEALAEARRSEAGAAVMSDGPRLRSALHVQAQASVRRGDEAAVRGIVDRFGSLAGPGLGRAAARDLDYFKGLLELERGRPLEALEFLERAAAALPPGDSAGSRKKSIYLDLGKARAMRGDFAGAAKAFETIVDAPGDRFADGDIGARAVLGLARAEDRLGRRARALERYLAFLELWRDADPGRPEVDEAKTRVAALSAAPGPGR